MELQELVERIQRWKRKQTGEFEVSDVPEAVYEGGGDGSDVAMVAPQVVSPAPEAAIESDVEAEALEEVPAPVDAVEEEVPFAQAEVEALAEPIEEEETDSIEPQAMIESESVDVLRDATEDIDDLEAYTMDESSAIEAPAESDEVQAEETETKGGEVQAEELESVTEDSAEQGLADELPNLEDGGLDAEDVDLGFDDETK